MSEVPPAVGVRDALDGVRAAYEEHHVRLWRAVLVWSGSSEVADEAVAETFAQLVRRGEAVEDPAAWAWRTAFRIAAAELKRQRAGSRDEIGEVSLPVGQPESVLDLMRALQHLTEQQRACVVVCDLLGYSAEEAWPHLHTTAATIRVQRMRARRRLRTLLEVEHV